MKDSPANSLPIGIFDSGVGGLTVFQAIRKTLPEENIIYLGDVARVPYGVKSPPLVRQYAYQITSYLIKKGIKVLVVACNTASATSLKFLEQNFSLPITGVILPGIKEALLTTRNKKVGILGTRTTVESGAYQKLIKSMDSSIEVFATPAPLLVPLVEEGWIDRPVTRMVIKEYLAPFKDWEVDTVILGCTHYPMLKQVMEQEAPGIKFVDAAKAVARYLRELMETQSLRGGNGKEEFLLTDTPEHYFSLFSLFLQREVKNIQLVKLEDFDEPGRLSLDFRP
ncbi:MAG: glutamate racemase [Caldiserica bacterium]|nr:glutamate racemase [Caldisericota bacterium]